jgi:signal transduction histidine kinase
VSAVSASPTAPAASDDASRPVDTAKPAKPPRRAPSLVRRLVVLHAILSAIVLLFGGLALAAFFAYSATDTFDDRLAQDVIDLVAGTSVDETGGVAAPALTDARTLAVYSGKYWELTSLQGGTTKPVARSRSLWDAPDITLPPGGAAALAASPGKPLFYDGVGPAPIASGPPPKTGSPIKEEPVRIAAEEVRIGGVPDPLIYLVSEDRSPIDTDIRTFDTSIGIALLVLLAMLVGGVALQVRVGLRPLFRLHREVADVRTGKTDRVVGEYPSELEPLASELNALVAHNQEVVERQRTHVGNLAHALKTPLSVMAAESEARPGPLAEVVRRQADVMRQQVDHHLRRARASARQHGGGERTEVAPVLEELSLTLERIFRDKGVEVDWRCPDDLFFHGERQDFLELAGNVMENACKWCKARVRVIAQAESPTLLSLAVEDDGPGLAAKDRDEVLQRGARLDETAPGSGLGLSIVDELARAYGGAVALGDSTLGGLRVTMTLPRPDG